jgi:asparagine synthase (glutamine-hydrolysing)
MCGIWGILSLDKINLNKELLYKKFNKIKSRGPDLSVYLTHSNYIIGFHRLAIIDTSTQGNQPYSLSYYYKNKNDENIMRTIYISVNGEIYNWKKLREDDDIKNFCNEFNYQYKSNSDCEVILIMFLIYIQNDFYINNSNSDSNLIQHGLNDLLNRLDGEFAISIYDLHYNTNTNKNYYNLWLARDRFGIRPLFYSELDNKTICFGSELKSIERINDFNKVKQINPRFWYYFGGVENTELFKCNKIYYIIGNNSIVLNPDPVDVYRTCRTLLIKSVIDRLNSDREIGCLLSGGLDSSLIASIASEELKKRDKILNTFSIGMANSPDVKYANIVSKHIGSNHTNFEIPIEEWINSIKEVIKISETFDITSVRATTAQYLICKKISETTNIKVLLIGDGSDEATGGYLYFHKTPNPMSLHFETMRLLNDIHYYDVLRADRGVATNGLEARVPFLSHEFINFYLKVDPALRIPKLHVLTNGDTNIYEKYLLRKSFDGINLLPESVLWRKKEAFSDGISSESKSWYQILQDMAESKITDDEFNLNIKKYQDYVEKTGENIIIPHTKEALYYHLIFDEFYPNQYHTIPYYWMPKWINNANDPSARTLDIYNDDNKKLNYISTNTKNYGTVSIQQY